MPHDEAYPDGSSRMQVVVERILAMPEREVVDTLRQRSTAFAGRHRDLDGVLDRNLAIVAGRLAHVERLDVLDAALEDRRRLIGAYFTHEYSIEAAALGNPSMVVGTRPVRPGRRRAPVRHEPAGDRGGHMSSIEFRSGVSPTPTCGSMR
jgi:hypothetical protein